GDSISGSDSTAPFVCDLADDLHCDTETKTCLGPHAIGAACTADHECGLGGACRSRKCVARAELGADCSKSGCAAKARCDENPTGVAAGPAGAPCSVADDCLTLSCLNGKCQAPDGLTACK